jgi:PAS domain S-box-containing protein
MVISAESIIRSDGSLDCIICTYQDITERKQVEQQMAVMLQRLDAHIYNSPMAVIELDPEFRVIRWSAEAEHLFGWTSAEVTGHAISEFRWVYEDDVAVVQHVSADMLNGKRPRNLSVNRNYRKDGSVVQCEWYNSAIYDEQGRLTSILSQVLDITARKKAEEELKQAKEDLELKVAERTHELAAKADQLRALASELTLTEQRERRRLAKILHDHLQQILVGGKFRLSVLGRGTDNLTKQGIKEVEELIDESIRVSRSLTAELSPPILHEAGLNAGLQWLAKRMADTHGIIVDLNLEAFDNLPDALNILLFEAARELLFNAIKHAKVLSACVSLRQTEGTLRLTVSDEGTGFDPKSLLGVGESGTGYGLFGIRERLHLLRGSLDIESSPGQGSRFMITVPMDTTYAQEPSTSPMVEKVHAEKSVTFSPDNKKIRLILADDHAVVRQGLSNVLGSEDDIEVVGLAANVREAVDLAAKLLPDVILMDVSMPVLNGVEATRIIRNEFPDICIIGLSMFEEAERAHAIRDAGASDYLTKSGPIEELVAAIRKAVSSLQKNYSASTQ